MSVLTFEGIVDQGKIVLPPNVHLPENAKVFVIVPNATPEPKMHIYSPRLTNPAQAVDFVMEVAPEKSHA